MRKLLIHFLYVKKNSSVGVESSAGNLLKRSMISLASETVVLKTALLLYYNQLGLINLKHVFNSPCAGCVAQHKTLLTVKSQPTCKPRPVL